MYYVIQYYEHIYLQYADYYVLIIKYVVSLRNGHISFYLHSAIGIVTNCYVLDGNLFCLIVFPVNSGVIQGGIIILFLCE